MATLFEKYYSLKPGARLKSDPQAAGEYLEQLESQFGRLTPKIVASAVETANAKGQTTPIHEDFTWDNKAAIAKCHVMEAGYLIRAIEVVVESGGEQVTEEPVRAFVSVVQNHKHGYVDVVTVLSNAQLRQQMLGRAYQELTAWRNRYDQLEEVAQIFKTRAVQRLQSVVQLKKKSHAVKQVKPAKIRRAASGR